ncbi:MAG: hypothetical protein WCI92_18530 [Bacteroidota bacterium]
MRKLWTFKCNLVTSKLKSSALRFRKGKTGMIMRGVGTKNQHAEDKLVNSIGRKIYMASGLAEGIGFKIERHGIFVHKGVGNGYIMQNGILIRGERKPKPGKHIMVQSTAGRLTGLILRLMRMLPIWPIKSLPSMRMLPIMN